MQRLTSNAASGLSPSNSDNDEQASSWSEEDDKESASTSGTTPQERGERGDFGKKVDAAPGVLSETKTVRPASSVSVTVGTQITT